LPLAKRLGENTDSLEETEIRTHLVGRFRNASEAREDLRVLFSRIGLAGERPAASELEALGEESVQLHDLALVPIEQREIAGLGTGSSFDAP
jgi:hypothetical protein